MLAETLSSLPVEKAIAWIRAQAHRRDSTRGLTPVVRDKVLRLTGRRMAVAGKRALLAMP